MIINLAGGFSELHAVCIFSDPIRWIQSMPKGSLFRTWIHELSTRNRRPETTSCEGIYVGQYCEKSGEECRSIFSFKQDSSY